jgi:hypothetical protein
MPTIGYSVNDVRKMIAEKEGVNIKDVHSEEMTLNGKSGCGCESLSDEDPRSFTVKKI